MADCSSYAEDTKIAVSAPYSGTTPICRSKLPKCGSSAEVRTHWRKSLADYTTQCQVKVNHYPYPTSRGGSAEVRMPWRKSLADYTTQGHYKVNWPSHQPPLRKHLAEAPGGSTWRKCSSPLHRPRSPSFLPLAEATKHTRPRSRHSTYQGQPLPTGLH